MTDKQMTEPAALTKARQEWAAVTDEIGRLRHKQAQLLEIIRYYERLLGG